MNASSSNVSGNRITSRLRELRKRYRREMTVEAILIPAAVVIIMNVVGSGIIEAVWSGHADSWQDVCVVLWLCLLPAFMIQWAINVAAQILEIVSEISYLKAKQY